MPTEWWSLTCDERIAQIVARMEDEKVWAVNWALTAGAVAGFIFGAVTVFTAWYYFG